MLDFFELADTLPPPPLPVEARDIPGLPRGSALLCGILVPPSPLSDPFPDNSLLPPPPSPPLSVFIWSFEPLFLQSADSFLPPVFSPGSFVAGKLVFDDFLFEKRDIPVPPPLPLFRRPVFDADEGAEEGLALEAAVERDEFGFLAAPLPAAGVNLEDSEGVPLAEDFAVDVRD